MDEKKDGEQQDEPEGTSHQPLKVDIEGIKKLLAIMDEHDLVELEMEMEDVAVRLKKRGADVAPQPAAAAPQAAPAPVEDAEPKEEFVEIKSPMVGTFFASPSPDAEALVKVGDTVNEETAVCIIEAMKVFNEIRAETTGAIVKVCVENGAAVEFGQTLFLVRPATP
ncbi:MAG: acetyl-CoA carboxylase biotin carboxyl carrier protein [Phycisphaerae bacterium]|jgi:acetyl-CoA carboxylase biotin carboxyl carrier protein|nr:acetyl-CoA carboxylase biotin carboxyl carrier protein [Phycisphaerae bacterium]